MTDALPQDFYLRLHESGFPAVDFIRADSARALRDGMKAMCTGCLKPRRVDPGESIPWSQPHTTELKTELLEKPPTSFMLPTRYLRIGVCPECQSATWALFRVRWIRNSKSTFKDEGDPALMRIEGPPRGLGNETQEMKILNQETGIYEVHPIPLKKIAWEGLEKLNDEFFQWDLEEIVRVGNRLVLSLKHTDKRVERVQVVLNNDSDAYYCEIFIAGQRGRQFEYGKAVIEAWPEQP